MEECYLVKLQALKPAALLKVTLLRGSFSLFLNYTNDIKSRKTRYIYKYTKIL